MSNSDSGGGGAQLTSTADYADWIDIAESEFVDIADGRNTFALVFEHEEIGLHGIKVDTEAGTLDAVGFETLEDDG